MLDLNGEAPVPALLLIPDKLQMRAPGLLFIHWHAGMYGLGKEELLRGVEAQPAYAPVCAEKGLVTLAIDSWCFGERQHEKDGHVGEEDTFKLMLWKGQVPFGMMLSTNCVRSTTWRAAPKWTTSVWRCLACQWVQRNMVARSTRYSREALHRRLLPYRF